MYEVIHKVLRPYVKVKAEIKIFSRLQASLKSMEMFFLKLWNDEI